MVGFYSKSVVGILATAILAAFVFLWPTPTATAQSLGVEKMGMDNSGDPMVALRNRMRTQQIQRIATEGAVDPDEYVVGPGDVYSISFGGAVAITNSIAVGADGKLVVPEVGGISVAGLTFVEAREKVLDILRPAFENVPVELSLEAPRQFFVHVTGAVPLPSRYLSNAVARVDDAIQLAYTKRAYERSVGAAATTAAQRAALERSLPTPTSERPPLGEGFRPSLRDIRIERTDGTILTVDLMTYYATGNQNENPYLRDGDVIVVSPYHEFRDAVRVEGEIPFAGAYPSKDGDTLTDVLTIAQGSPDLSTLETARVARRHADGVSVEVVNVADVVAGRIPDPAIHPQDVVRIPQLQFDYAAVWGWVDGPGTYPIHGGVTTITDILEIAGPILDDADLEAAYVSRSSPTLITAPVDNSELDFFARVFYQAESAEPKNVVVDVAAILAGEAEDFVLEHGDAVVFPRRESTVLVLGAVANPGYVDHQPGEDAAYYIAKAGGLTDMGTQTYVLQSPNGQIGAGTGIEVPRGATVFANRAPLGSTPEVQSLLVTDVSAKRQYRLSTTQTIISGVSAIAAIITTFVAITR